MKHQLPMFAQVCMLPITPENSQQAYNRLRTLDYLDSLSNPHHDDIIRCTMSKPSKRRERLARMYWAFRKAGK